MYYSSVIEKKKTRIVDGIKIPTKETYISSGITLSAEAGTTSLKTANQKEINKSFIKILNTGYSDIKVERNSDGKGFTIRTSGKQEIKALINAFDFISSVLKEQIKENDKEFDISVSSSEDPSLITEKQKKYINSLLKKYGLKMNEKELSKKKAIKLIEELVENDKDKSKNISEEFFTYITELD